MHGSDEKVNGNGVTKTEQEREHMKDPSDGRSVKTDIKFGLKVCIRFTWLSMQTMITNLRTSLMAGIQASH
jgi:hypothetical protein